MRFANLDGRAVVLVDSGAIDVARSARCLPVFSAAGDIALRSSSGTTRSIRCRAPVAATAKFCG